MNTRNIFIIAAALLLIAASCQSVLEEQVQEEPKVTDEIVEDDGDTKIQAPDITAAQEGDNPSKSVLEVDGDGVGTIYWTPADEINVFYGTTSTHYVSQNTVNATTAVFSTTDIIGISEGASENIWGLYPYNPSASCTGSAVSTTLPATQYGVPGTFDDDLFITLAHNTSTALTFYNVCGGIKFSLSRDDITEITFRGNNNEDIAGDISLAFSEGLPTVSVTSGVNEIILTPKTGGTFVSGENYYIILLPITLSNGFTMTFTATDGTLGTFNYNTKAVNVKRSVFSKKAEINTYASFIPFPKSAFYTSTDGNPITPSSNNIELSSNTYSNGIGIMTFASVPQYFWGFENQTTLQSIILPPEVFVISNNAFKGCSNLESVVIRDGVEAIYNNAFMGCEQLSSITFPASLYDIYENAFNGCTSLVSVDCSGLLGTIPFGRYAFANCTSLSTISLPSKATELNIGLFRGCSSLGSVTIPSKVTRIRDSAFSGCTNLSSVTIPNSVTTIDDSVFENCTSLTTVTLPSKTATIGSYAFAGCSGLSYIRILATTPPTCSYSFEYSTCPIYVPAEYVDVYKSTSGWSRYADRIQANP